jgi:DHA2 family multidrug resistance protein
MTDQAASAPAAAPPAAPGPAPIPWFGLAAVLLGTFISTLNGRLSTFGLSDIRGAVHAGFDEGAWITTSQTVAQMLIAPAAIWAGNAYGPRRVLIHSAIAFALISLLTPYADSLRMLLVLRFAGGLASGVFIPLTMGFILLNTPPKVWAYGIALYALNLEFSLNVSASLEGWYVDHLSWRWIIWQNVPLALGMALCLHFSPRRPAGAPNVKPPSADLYGMLTFGVGLSLIYAALDQGNRLDWLNSGLVVAFMASGLLLVAAFILHDALIANPLINLKTAITRPLPSLLGLISFLRLTILSTAYLIPQFLGGVRGYRALEVGQSLVWIALPQLLICPLAGFFLRRIDPRMVAATGFILISIACTLVAQELTPQWGTDQFLPSSLLQAVGQSFALSGIVFFAVQHVRPQDAITFGTMLQTARLMGGEIGQAFVVTFERVRAQIASNHIGLHVQAGSAAVDQRIQTYAAATRRAGDTVSGLERGAAILAGVVRGMATTQGVIDSFAALACLAAAALVLVVAQRAAPRGPATHVSIFAPRSARTP